MTATAEIISIGDELLYGQTLDTNAHWISHKLDEYNIKVFQRTTIGDDADQILNAFATASSTHSSLKTGSEPFLKNFCLIQILCSSLLCS